MNIFDLSQWNQKNLQLFLLAHVRQYIKKLLWFKTGYVNTGNTSTYLMMNWKNHTSNNQLWRQKNSISRQTAAYKQSRERLMLQNWAVLLKPHGHIANIALTPVRSVLFWIGLAKTACCKMNVPLSSACFQHIFRFSLLTFYRCFVLMLQKLTLRLFWNKEKLELFDSWEQTC